MSDGITQHVDGLIHHLDEIQAGDDESKGLLTSVNVGSALSIPQARGNEGHGELHKTNVRTSSPMWMISVMFIHDSMNHCS